MRVAPQAAAERALEATGPAAARPRPAAHPALRGVSLVGLREPDAEAISVGEEGVRGRALRAQAAALRVSALGAREYPVQDRVAVLARQRLEGRCLRLTGWEARASASGIGTAIVACAYVGGHAQRPSAFAALDRDEPSRRHPAGCERALDVRDVYPATRRTSPAAAVNRSAPAVLVAAPYLGRRIRPSQRAVSHAWMYDSRVELGRAFLRPVEPDAIGFCQLRGRHARGLPSVSTGPACSSGPGFGKNDVTHRFDGGAWVVSDLPGVADEVAEDAHAVVPNRRTGPSSQPTCRSRRSSRPGATTSRPSRRCGQP